VKLAYLSLGSNMGDRERMLQAAIEALGAPDLRILRLSPVYETEPVDLPGQPWFLNLVAEVETRLFPRQLLARTSKVEHQLGRRRTVAKGPRTIDIDILFYGNVTCSTAALTLPHPRFAERRFVLAPMADLAPGLRDPASGRTISELLKNVSGQAVRKVAFAPVLRD
jgi:2-amino-4-hydroxy-6-hydroxymethyldihydropteridine diphosphokinase